MDSLSLSSPHHSLSHLSHHRRTAAAGKNIRRPNTHNPLKPPSKPTSKNPLKTLLNPNPLPTPNPQTLTNKLWLTSHLTPPIVQQTPTLLEKRAPEKSVVEETTDSVPEAVEQVEFRQKGKIFVGNLPLWIKKHELEVFFRQFGPIENLVLIKGYDDVERNMGFGFVIYGGDTAEKSAMKAVEFDGVEFHGRVLTVKLDDGRRVKERVAGRERWMGGGEEEFRTRWHEEREGSRRELKRVLETQPENWQAVIRAFERVKKVLHC